MKGLHLFLVGSGRGTSPPRKIYPVDPALIHAFDVAGRANEGHALETVVLGELERRKAKVGYVKSTSGFEVDSHARFPDGKDELIEVWADLSSAQTRERTQGLAGGVA
ncbi:MAG: ATP-binding protein [Ignavibacteria bacterium]|nr:ATP-binding protein [Ignavibacteria bacterium]